MKKIQGWLQELLNQFKSVIADDDRRRSLVFNCFAAIMGWVSFGMTVVNLWTGKYLLMCVTLIFALLCALNYYLSRKGGVRKKIAYHSFFIEGAALCAFFCISGAPEGFSALWSCFIPSFALTLLGVRKGSAYAGVGLLVIIFLFWTPAGKSLLQYEYTASFLLRFPMIYVAFYATAVFLEIVREQTLSKTIEAKNQYQYLYRHDALTGLLNRYGFNEHLDKLYQESSGMSIALMILDLDGFKKVNDTYGHRAGDEVLRYVADLINRRMGDHGVACRWGGEEFTILMVGIEDPQQFAGEICQELREAKIEADHSIVRITVSIGICELDNHKQTSPAVLVSSADRCLYAAKAAGRDQVCVTRL